VSIKGVATLGYRPQVGQVSQSLSRFFATSAPVCIPVTSCILHARHGFSAWCSPSPVICEMMRSGWRHVCDPRIAWWRSGGESGIGDGEPAPAADTGL